MLRHKMLAINYLIMHFIAQLITQGLQNHPESIALVMRQQIFDVFQQKSLGALGGNNACHIEKQCALSCAFKTVRTAKCIFF